MYLLSGSCPTLKTIWWLLTSFTWVSLCSWRKTGHSLGTMKIHKANEWYVGIRLAVPHTFLQDTWSDLISWDKGSNHYSRWKSSNNLEVTKPNTPHPSDQGQYHGEPVMRRVGSDRVSERNHDLGKPGLVKLHNRWKLVSDRAPWKSNIGRLT